MANNDDLNQQYQQSDPNQWQQQQPGAPGQDLSEQAGAPYGLAGQGQMGDAMNRDVDPNMAGQMGQDPNQQQGNLGQDPYQQQSGQADQDPYQQQAGQMGNQGNWDPNQQQGNVGQPNQQQDNWNDQGMMAGGYGGNQPDPNQAGQMQPNMDDLDNPLDQGNL